jgi:glycogen operon protein
MCLIGRALEEQDERGRPVVDDDVLVLLNAHHEEIPFSLPSLGGAGGWQGVIDTQFDSGFAPEVQHQPGELYPLQGRSVALLIRS